MATPKPTDTPQRGLFNTPTPFVTITSNGNEKLSAPTSVYARYNSANVIISWQAVDGAEKYNIYRSRRSIGPYYLIESVSINQYIETHVVLQGSTYYYKVASVAGTVLSEQSDYASISIPKPTPTSHPIQQFKNVVTGRYRLLDPGCEGEDVLQARTRLYELGYFDRVPTQTEFTIAMMKYVMAFQRANSLPETGILSQEEQAYLFSDYAIPKPTPTPTPTKKPTPTPKPTETPYPEPKYPISFGSDGYTGTPSDPYINPKIVNRSKKKTVDGFTLTYYCTTVFGEKINFDDTNDYYSNFTYVKTIGPGKSIYPGKVYLSKYYSQVKRIFVAITRIHTTDGRTYNIPEAEWDFYYWELD